MRSSHNLQGIIDYQDSLANISFEEEKREMKRAEKEERERKLKEDFENLDLKLWEKLLFNAIAYGIVAGGAFLAFKVIASIFHFIF